MSDDDQEEGGTARISMLLGMAKEGDAQAFQQVFEAAYPELRALARARLRRQPNDVVGATALVHEAYLRLASGGTVPAEHRPHFFRYASRVMRSVIVDMIRERNAQRRGGGARHDAFTTQMTPLGRGGEDEVLRIHAALDSLAEHDPRMVDVVQMRYFAGMTDVEIGAALGVTERTVRRDWEKARLLLLEALDEG